jgi:homogentisate phytyltransferase/homogentisate geranylgeranyltransferase
MAMAFPESLVATAFFAVFGVVIAIMKDVPDVQGDKLFEIPSFSVKKGAALMFR